jgi:hypothetical protein
VSVDATKLVIPGHGTVFHAPKDTACPANPLSAFTLTGAPPAGWTNVGHTSKANTVAFSKEGGEPEKLDTFLADGVRTVYSSLNWGVTVPALQFDEDVLDLAFNGDFDPATGGYIVPGSVVPVEAALFVYFKDTTGALGFWIPNTVVTLGEAPGTDPAAFTELPLNVSIQSADTGVIPEVNGVPGLFEIFKTGLSQSVPIISTVLPSGAAAGELVTITGSGFTGATSVTVGGTEVADFTVINDGYIVASLPAGAAGSAPVIVTNAQGASTAKAYTRA